MIFESTSQAGQDQWVGRRIPTPGLFLDVGCGHPFNGSNTASLERLGWVGYALDWERENIALYAKARPNTRAMAGDATTIHWTACLPMRAFDYLSLDVDEAQVAALKNLLAHKITFRVATVEHDSYAHGNAPRDEIRSLLAGAGYLMAEVDVECGGKAFEDWWVSPGSVAS